MLPTLLFLAQVPMKALTADEPRLDSEPTSILTLLLGVLFVILALVTMFKLSKRNQIQE